MKKILVLVAMVLLIAGTAFADPFNTRPAAGTNLASLRSNLDTLYGPGIFDVNNQATAAIYQPSVVIGPTSSSFMLLLEIAGYDDENTFGIYSYSDPNKKLQVFAGPDSPFDSAAVSFQGGSVQLGNHPSTKILNFGTAFGFYIATGGAETFYSEDSKNPGGLAQMLIYEFPGVANEYIIAIEDLNRVGSDSDFDDMLVKASEVKPVPEPATMLLLGSGLIGLAGYARRRFKK